MNTPRIATLVLLGCLPLLACDKSAPAPDNTSANDPAGAPTTLLGKAVKEATDEARKELATGNMKLSASGQPTAEITPTGELIVNGKTVPIDAAQKALLLEYRKGIAEVAEAGIGVGLQGADLAGKAMTEAVKGIFTGNTEQIEQRIEAEADGIRQSAMQLCEKLPALKATQDKLAAALPAFKPYANMDQSDIEDCMRDQNGSYDAGKNVGSTIAKAIHGDGAGVDAAEEAEAAGAEPATKR